MCQTRKKTTQITPEIKLTRQASKNVFKIQSLAELKVDGKCKKLFIVKASVKYKVKYIKLPSFTPDIN